jgi:hypothetical protein
MQHTIEHLKSTAAAIEPRESGATAEPIAHPIEDVPGVSGLTRTLVFGAIREKRLMARKSGRRTIIERAELERFIATLPTRGRKPDEATA